MPVEDLARRGNWCERWRVVHVTGVVVTGECFLESDIDQETGFSVGYAGLR